MLKQIKTQKMQAIAYRHQWAPFDSYTVIPSSVAEGMDADEMECNTMLIASTGEEDSVYVPVEISHEGIRVIGKEFIGGTARSFLKAV